MVGNAKIVARYRRAAHIIEVMTVSTMCVAMIAISIGLNVYVGLVFILIAVAIYPLNWRLNRKAAEIVWNARVNWDIQVPWRDDDNDVEDDDSNTKNTTTK